MLSSRKVRLVLVMAAMSEHQIRLATKLLFYLAKTVQMLKTTYNNDSMGKTRLNNKNGMVSLFNKNGMAINIKIVP